MMYRRRRIRDWTVTVILEGMKYMIFILRVLLQRRQKIDTRSRKIQLQTIHGGMVF